MDQISRPVKYKQYHIKGWVIMINPRFAVSESIISCTATAEENFDNIRGPFEKIDSSRYARVYKCPVGIKGRKVSLYLKYFLNRSFIDLAKHIFRPSRAMRSLIAGRMLAEKGFNCPAVVAVAEKKLGPLCLSCVLITEEITEAYDLYCYIHDYWKVNIIQTPQEKRDMIKQLGWTIGKMHAKGIFHGDLRLGNIFAGVDRDKWTFYFIDNERTRCFNKLPWRYRVKNLVQCNMLRRNVTRTDRLRFFREYSSYLGLTAGQKKKLITEVLRITDKRHSRK